MSQKFPLVSCFRWIFRFSMLKASAYLPRLLWIYVLIIHTPLDLHPEPKVRLFKSSNSLSLYLGIIIRKLHSYELIQMEHYQDLLNSWRYAITWTSYFKLQLEMHIISNVKLKVLTRHLMISKELFYWTQVIINNFGCLPISMTYGSSSKPRIYYMVMLLTSSVM